MRSRKGVLEFITEMCLTRCRRLSLIVKKAKSETKYQKKPEMLGKGVVERVEEWEEGRRVGGGV